ncbi:hypothetical protein A2801_00790 [Candidatus Woesebacteria bacterium RIFCSPHIGHO2_01_FULL_41_10]|uniref:Uncharacterized protein n=1 Tax=Candidatus Woesebacteria bacterium RIFCSPHIGHO2_01_FULL_41_10 TaxID=1802500 RepID=A0A1F7YRR0_9BACT|nr:MAG: hypothetical protein A2801_00790 [Candidatus Woesebacteria bacterium RIFCSPHIGHO2_01_FULL_41_10]
MAYIYDQTIVVQRDLNVYVPFRGMLALNMEQPVGVVPLNTAVQLSTQCPRYMVNGNLQRAVPILWNGGEGCFLIASELNSDPVRLLFAGVKPGYKNLDLCRRTDMELDAAFRAFLGILRPEHLDDGRALLIYECLCRDYSDLRPAAI